MTTLTRAHEPAHIQDRSDELWLQAHGGWEGLQALSERIRARTQGRLVS